MEMHPLIAFKRNVELIYFVVPFQPDIYICDVF